MAIGNDGGYEAGVAITPNDSTDIPIVRALSCTAAGNVSVIFADDRTNTAVTLSIAVGIPLRVRVKRVRATGTTATGLVGLT